MGSQKRPGLLDRDKRWVFRNRRGSVGLLFVACLRSSLDPANAARGIVQNSRVLDGARNQFGDWAALPSSGGSGTGRGGEGTN